MKKKRNRCKLCHSVKKVYKVSIARPYVVLFLFLAKWKEKRAQARRDTPTMSLYGFQGVPSPPKGPCC